MIGDTAVGKSCLLLRFADDEFTDAFITTVGVDFRFRTVTVGNRTVKLQIWDTAGQERFRTITSAYYRGADGVIMVYDVTQRESFSKVRDWLLEVDKYASAETAKLLIGNKSDRTDRAVTTEEGQALARELSLPFLETSARIGDNVEAAFKEITEQLIKSRISKREEAERARVELTAQKVQTQSGGKSGCC